MKTSKRLLPKTTWKSYRESENSWKSVTVHIHNAYVNSTQHVNGVNICHLNWDVSTAQYKIVGGGGLFFYQIQLVSGQLHCYKQQKSELYGIIWIFIGFFWESAQYKLLYTISNNIEVYSEPVPWTKIISHRAVKFQAGEENRIVTKVCTENNDDNFNPM